MNATEQAVDAITVFPATPDRWPDIVTIFVGQGPEREGGDRGCWCQYWRASSSAYGRLGPGGGRRALREQGAPALEGYPVDPAGGRVDTAFGYVRFAPMFAAAGFREVVETDARSDGRPRILMRLDLG